MSDNNETHLGRALRWYMNEQGISLRDLSKRLDIPHTTLHRFMKDGDNLSILNFLKLMTWAMSTINL